MRLNAMLLLLLNLLFLCELLRCDEFKPVNSDVPTHTEHKARRSDNLMSHTTEVLVNSTQGTDQRVHITTQQSFHTAPPGNQHTQDNPPSLLTPSSPFANGSSASYPLHREPVYLRASSLIFSSNSPSGVLHSTPSTVRVSTRFPSPTASSISSLIARSGVSASNVSKSCPASGTYPASTPPFNFDPSVAEIAKNWLHGVTSPTESTPKGVVPKLTLIFDYDLSTQRFPHNPRRNEKTERKKSNGQLRVEIITNPLKSKRIPPESEIPTFWHNPPKELPLKRSKIPQPDTSVTKARLKPDLLLGKAKMSDIKKEEDVEEYEKAASGKVESKVVLRMHKIVEVTKKAWYSDRTGHITKDWFSDWTGKESKRAGTAAPTTKKQPPKKVPAPITTTTKPKTLPTTKNKNKEVHQETYMIDFMIELMRLIAKKEEKVVHEVIKHTDQILHGVYKSRQLQWLSQPFIDFTRQIMKSLKESETRIIQNQAAGLSLMLKERRQKLSGDVNAALEYADRLYTDDEREQLLKVLNDFTAFPNTTLNGYWLCNSIVNNFLKPYRRLTDPGQRQQLMNSVNLALKTSFTSNKANETNALRSGGVRPADIPPGKTSTEKTVSSTSKPRQRKRKLRHRSHKRKRGRKRHRKYRTRPQNKYNNSKDLTLRSITPKNGVKAG